MCASARLVAILRARPLPTPKACCNKNDQGLARVAIPPANIVISVPAIAGEASLVDNDIVNIRRPTLRTEPSDDHRYYFR